MALNMIGHDGKVPDQAPAEEENDEDLLKKIHHALGILKKYKPINLCLYFTIELSNHEN